MHLYIFCSQFCQPAMFPQNKGTLIPTPPPWTTWAGWTFLAGPLGLGYPALFVPLDQFQRPPTTWSTWLTPGWTLPAWIFPMAAMNITEKQLPIAGFEYFVFTYFSRLGWLLEYSWGKSSKHIIFSKYKIPNDIQHLLKLATFTKYKRDIFSTNLYSPWKIGYYKRWA